MNCVRTLILRWVHIRCLIWLDDRWMEYAMVPFPDLSTFCRTIRLQEPWESVFPACYTPAVPTCGMEDISLGGTDMFTRTGHRYLLTATYVPVKAPAPARQAAIFPPVPGLSLPLNSVVANNTYVADRW